MSRLCTLQPGLRRRGSKASIAASDTTYHSFQDLDIEMRAPITPPRAAGLVAIPGSGPGPAYSDDDDEKDGGVRTSTDSAYHQQPPPPPPPCVEMRRQDSGYESLPPRPSHSSSRRRTSTVSSASRPRSRPSARRATKSASASSGSVSASVSQAAHHYPGSTSSGASTGSRVRTTQSLYLSHSHQSHAQQEQQHGQLHHHHPLAGPMAAFFHFPSPDPTLPQPDEPAHHRHPSAPASSSPSSPTPPPPPPATTHYWTSDRTRRLEYAAIDAASRGLKGWCMRHLVPDCFVPREKRLVGFDDDRGSVRRYRLELEDADESVATAATAANGFEKARLAGGSTQGGARRAAWPWGRRGGLATVATTPATTSTRVY